MSLHDLFYDQAHVQKDLFQETLLLLHPFFYFDHLMLDPFYPESHYVSARYKYTCLHSALFAVKAAGDGGLRTLPHKVSTIPHIFQYSSNTRETDWLPRPPSIGHIPSIIEALQRRR